ncbi:Vitamin B6 photo-protection and homoeostasis [Novymonas esmeraldas]|uniref:Vitamin B6 photo-protection and homoeostasis n=1 Tax=Novymonas esmeraldas TaxID=1808958 RepID=A0AAW0EP43_9TRYP
MLVEFAAGRRVSYRVNAQRGGAVEATSETYASDYFQERDGGSPAAPSSPTGPAPTWNVRRRARAALVRVFLPDGYPNSVTDDLLAFAVWDLVQVLANNVMAMLSMRAVLLGVGVGESTANLTSSTLSWMMRDGTWMIGSVVFASLISQDLEYRAKTWRLVADFTNDIASLLELCAPWLPGGQLTFRAVVIVASVIKALVGVCGSGTRASFTQHFALRSNAADVSAKAATRGNVGGLIGLALGVAVAYVVPATSPALTLAVFTVSTAVHIFANYRGVRGVQLRHLNPPRLEWCLEEYCAVTAAAVVAAKKETGALSAPPALDLSPQRANAAEPLFALPALRAMPPPNGGVADAVYRVLRQRCFPVTLVLRMHCGASLARVLRRQGDLTARRKQELVQQAEESLATRGVALLVDDVDMSYHVLVPEYSTAAGVPESWVRYERQHLASLKHAASKRRPPVQRTQTSATPASREVEAEEVERLRRERVVVPPHILPLAYRQLWAYFYAYAHCCAARRRREGMLPQSNAVIENPSKSRSLECQRLHLITVLRADGMLDEAGSGAAAGADDAVYNTPLEFDQLTSPTSPTAAVTAPHDGLYPHFIEFVRALRKAGWELDRLLVNDEGFTTVVEYL